MEVTQKEFFFSSEPIQSEGLGPQLEAVVRKMRPMHHYSTSGKGA